MAYYRRLIALGAGLSWAIGCGSSTPDIEASAGAPSGGGNTAGSAGSGGGNPNTSGSTTGDAGSGSKLTGSAAELARRLGRKPNFLIGMGSDYDASGDHSKDGAYLLGSTLDLHDGYLVGLLGRGGWTDWNAGGTFVNVLSDSAAAKGVAPMYTLYSMAANGDGNLSGLTDDAYMKPYWDGLKLLYLRLAAFGKPALVHFEPDFWAYAELQSHDDPAALKVNVTANAPDCAGLSNDLIGMGHCMVKLARLYAPQAMIGFHASQWSAPDPSATVNFLRKVGADQADLVISDLLDRDAGCFEAGSDPNCQRGGSFYWDESNQTSPNFHEYLAWSKAMSSGLGRPILWWQVPFGVPSANKGGSKGHYRDNRVHYIFEHIQEFVAAGGLGVAFGAGAENQTTPASDGGQFKAAVSKYYAASVALP